VPEHWAVGTAEEQYRRILHHQVPHDLGVPIGGDHEDKPHEVKYGNIEVASSTISIMKRNLTSRQEAVHFQENVEKLRA